jgi:CobQ-like glutamine amidotransferase family enzyme
VLPDEPSAVRLAVLFPELLGTYGDTGNALVLERRLAWRGIPVTTVRTRLDQPVPTGCDIYLLGGGEDVAQTEAVGRLRSSPGLSSAAQGGAVVFGVCAGLQLLGQSFEVPGEGRVAGLGLLDAVSGRSHKRVVGDAIVDASASGFGLLTGFENHAGTTRLGEESRPLGQVVRGTGNGDGSEGAQQDRVFATYLHGPVLARNPALADHLLSLVVGELPPLEIPAVTKLQQRLLGGYRKRLRATRRASAWPRRSA